MEAKKRAIVLASVCLIILVITLGIYFMTSKSYLISLNYNQVIEKVNKKEDFALLISKTDCVHCNSFKPKLSRICKKYKLNVYYIDVDLMTEKQNEEFKKYFNYDGTPNLVFVVDGEEMTAANRINGDVSEDKIIAKFKSNGYIK